MKSYRFISLALLTAMLAASSCGESGSGEVTTAADSTESTAPAEVFPVEKCDFGGEEFRILYPNWFLYNDYFFCEEETGDIMDDALVERARLTEEHLGVEIKPICFGYIETIAPKVAEAVLAGDDAYDLALTHCISGVSTMISEGHLLDMNTLPGITFDEQYWNERMNTELEVFGKRYYTVSDFMLGDPNAILFNKRMIESYKLDDPYKLVTDGKWTWDKLTEMSRKVSQDVDGNSVWDENDIYGFAAQAEWKMISVMYSCDQYMVREDGDSFKIDINNEKMIDIIAKMDKLFNGDNSSFIWTASTNTYDTGIITDRVLFDLAALNDSAMYRDSEVDFGILPFPKYDEAQKEYISLNWCGLMCVPISAKNTEKIGKTLEMLAYFSKDTTQPAYREVLLGNKLARDDDSVEMLEIIFDGLVCDFGLNYLGFSDLTYTIPRMVARDKSTDFASWYDRHIPTAEKTLADLVKAVKDN